MKLEIFDDYDDYECNLIINSGKYTGIFSCHKGAKFYDFRKISMKNVQHLPKSKNLALSVVYRWKYEKVIETNLLVSPHPSLLIHTGFDRSSV